MTSLKEKCFKSQDNSENNINLKKKELKIIPTTKDKDKSIKVIMRNNADSQRNTFNCVIDNPPFIKTLFPWKKNVDYYRLQMTKIGKYSISNRYDSTQLSKIIRKILSSFKMKTKNVTLTDATASIGGNAISFSMFLGKINAIEIDSLTFGALKNNIEQYRLSNVTLFNENCLNIIYNLEEQDIVFFDPPWGGKKYKEENEIDLYLGAENMIDITNRLCEKKLLLVVMKIPKNFAIKRFIEGSKYPYFYLLNCKKYNILFLWSL